MTEHIKLKGNRVFLILPDSNYKSERQVGFIKDRTFFTRRTERHLFRKLNAFGINYELLKNGGVYFDKICIEYGFEKLLTTREFFLTNGTFLHFQTHGLDKQVFLPIEKFGLHKAITCDVVNQPTVKKRLPELTLFR